MILLTTIAGLALSQPPPSLRPSMMVPPTPGLRAFHDEPEPDPAGWHGGANLGASFTSGNSEVTTFAASARAEKKTETGRITLGAFWNFAEQKDAATNQTETTLDNTGLDAQYDHFLSERLYWWTKAFWFRDKLADLDARYGGDTGLGYQFYDTETFSLKGEAGLGWIKEDFGDNASDTDYFTARIAYGLGWQINENVRFEQDAEAFPSLENGDDIYARVDSRLSSSLVGNLQAQLRHLLLYDNTPSPGLERADHIVTVGLGWTF